MANRRTLHISRLDAFKNWLVKDGWTIEEPKGMYEVLRARKPGKKYPLIVYKKATAKEHLSLLDRDIGVLNAFINDGGLLSESEKKRREELVEMLQELDREKKPTNGDMIRSMTDEQLAEFIANDCIILSDKICGGCHQPDTTQCGSGACTEYLVKWLQSESED